MQISTARPCRQLGATMCQPSWRWGFPSFNRAASDDCSLKGKAIMMTSPVLAPSAIEARTLRKYRTWIIPPVFVLFVVNYVDRINIGFAAQDVARQLRPYFPWSVPARKSAWLRYWRLCRWWRRCPEKDKGPTPLERLSTFPI